jgi:uncharacterized protein YjiS (DUF1127 family)
VAHLTGSPDSDISLTWVFTLDRTPVLPPLCHSSGKPGITTNENEFAPRGWSPKVFFNNPPICSGNRRMIAATLRHSPDRARVKARLTAADLVTSYAKRARRAVANVCFRPIADIGLSRSDSPVVRQQKHWVSRLLSHN